LLGKAGSKKMFLTKQYSAKANNRRMNNYINQEKNSCKKTYAALAIKFKGPRRFYAIPLIAIRPL
jgi:glucose-6-phosphate 1-dehydrogenase